MRCFVKISSVIALCLYLTACGGGSDSETTISNPPPPTGNTGPTWTQGVFESSNTFVNRCENPRSGIVEDAFGNTKEDIQGTTLEENHWLRSFSDETYFWYDEILDRNPANFNDPLVYFDLLKTQAITASGKDKDEFHFTFNTEEYTQLVSSGASAGYGAEFSVLASAQPRDIRVAFTEPNSPASSVNLMRGAKLLTINGVDVINGGTQADVDVLNAALRPNAGDTYTFVVEDLGSTTPRTITMTAEIVTSAPVQNEKIINTPSGDVGYLTFNTFGTQTAEIALFDAFTDFQNANISDLVVDLRYNGGGFLGIASQLAYMIAGPAATSGKTFEQLIFNDKTAPANPVPFRDTGIGFTVAENQPLPSLNLNRVFILSTDGTCSASEAVINGLRGVDVEVILIGDTTCGKPFGFGGTDNCSTTYFTVQFQGVNDKGFGDYADGFAAENSSNQFAVTLPGCLVEDDYTKLLGDETEGLLKAALDYRSTGLCPAPAINANNKAAPFRLNGEFEQDDLFYDKKYRLIKHLEQRRLYKNDLQEK